MSDPSAILRVLKKGKLMFCDVCNAFVDSAFDGEVTCIDCALAGYDVDVEEIELDEVW